MKEEIIKQLWEETSQIIKIADEIDDVFHRNGYVISHDKIEHFVVDCIKGDQRRI